MSINLEDANKLRIRMVNITSIMVFCLGGNDEADQATYKRFYLLSVNGKRFWEKEEWVINFRINTRY